MSLIRVALLMERLVGFNHDVMQGVRDFAGPEKHWVCHFIDPRPELLDLVQGWEPHGILAFLGDDRFGCQVASLNVPFVDVAAWVDRPGWPRVGLDDKAVGVMAAEHLLGLGLEHFAFLGNTQLAFSSSRLLGFRSELEQAGYSLATFATDPARFPTTRRFTMGGLDGELVSWLMALHKPVGIFADNDERALLASEGCRAAGIDIPEEVALLGVDNDPYLCGLGYPQLSSIATPARRLGFEAARRLETLMQGRSDLGNTLLQPLGVVSRRSTDVLAFPDPDVSAAILFLRNHACSGVGVEDVASAVRIGRRTLERRFQRFVGRSVGEEIARTRLQNAKRIICTTDEPVKSVAAASGYRSIASFSTAFRKEFGVAPHTLRKSVGEAISNIL